MLCVTPDPPSWVILNERAAQVLAKCEGRTPTEVVAELSTAWADGSRRTRISIGRTIHGLREAGLVDPTEQPAPYRGRDQVVAPGRLNEIWVYTNRRCNLSCSHCFLGDWNRDETPLDTAAIRSVLADARALGVERVNFTGGEPLLRSDLPELIDYVTETLGCELVVLTNGTALRGRIQEALAGVAGPRLTLQISLESAEAAVHESVRGRGTFERTIDGIRAAVDMGVNTVVATTLTGANAASVHHIPARVAKLGVKVMHVHWLYRDGRASGDDVEHDLDAHEVVEAMKRLQGEADAHGVVIDNAASFSGRVAGPRGCRTDLCHAALEVLSVDADGQVYACAPATGDSAFRLGSIHELSLEDIWRESPAARRIRGASVARKPECAECDLRFVCGGGCLYRAHLQHGSVTGSPAGDDFCDAYRAILLDEMWATARPDTHPDDPPEVLSSMGTSAGVCEPTTRTVDFDSAPVSTYRCACYLASELPVEDGHGRTTWSCFSDMAPDYDGWANGHLGTAYGAAIREHVAPVFDQVRGAHVLEVGCGTGNYLLPLAEVAELAVGVDASDAMLRVARRKSRAFGIDVQLEHAFAEDLPFEADTFDVVYSINALEFVQDRAVAVAEMCRVLRPGGTLVVGVLNRRGTWGLAQRIRRPFEPPDAAYYQGQFLARDELTALLGADADIELVSLDGAVSFPPVDVGWVLGAWTRATRGRLGALLGQNVLIARARKPDRDQRSAP